MIRAGFFRALLVLATTFALGACVTTAPRETMAIDNAVDIATPAPETSILPGRVASTPASGLREPVRVAILVPQSGPNAALGSALLQAAQLAVFDVNEPQFQLIPEDTKGTVEGTRAAVDAAARTGARLILGPLFAHEVDAAREAARTYGLTVVGFSTDWRVAGDNVFTMGVLPFGQVERVADYAARQGLRRVAVLTSTDMYGDAVSSLFQSSAQRNGMSVTKIVRIAPDGRDAASAIQQLTGGQIAQDGSLPFDAIFMPLGGQAAHIVASTLKSYGMGTGRVKLLGTGLWDDPKILSDSNMAGAIYAAPAPQVRAAFERNYQRIYGSLPPRLASIGYDAAALAIVMARNASASGARVTYDRAAFLNPNGFSGVDGIFRFRTNGLVERGMAILQIGGGTAHLVEPAPGSFVGMAN